MCVHAWVHACAHVCACERMRVCAWMHVCECARVSTCVDVVCVCMCVCACVWMHVCECVRVCVHTCARWWSVAFGHTRACRQGCPGWWTAAGHTGVSGCEAQRAPTVCRARPRPACTSPAHVQVRRASYERGARITQRRQARPDGRGAGAACRHERVRHSSRGALHTRPLHRLGPCEAAATCEAAVWRELVCSGRGHLGF